MFLQSSLPWQRCDPEKGKQGRKRPEKGLRGPYRELSTGPMCRKSQSVWPRRAPMPLEPHGQRFVGGHCPVLGCAGREPRREPLGERVPRPLSGPLAQPSSACCCSWGLPAEGPGLPGGPERHWAQRDCGEPTDLVGPGTMVEDEVGPSGLGREAPRDCSPFLLPQPLLGPGHGGLYPSPRSPVQQPGLGVEGPAMIDDQAWGMRQLIREGPELLESAPPAWRARERLWGEVGGTGGRFWRLKQQKR